MKKPDGLIAFYNEADGTERPLLLPRAMLEEARLRYPTLWIEASPELPVIRPKRKRAAAPRNPSANRHRARS